MYPKEYSYTQEHEWLSFDGDVYTLGITDFAQKELGEVVFADMPDVGSECGDGDELGSLESVKAVAEFYAPLSGEVVEVNEALEDSPEKINEDPHGEGWICKIRFNPETIDRSQLLDAASYAEFAQSDD